MLANLRPVLFQLPVIPAHELKVWVHQSMAEGDSEALPARLEVGCGVECRRQDLNLAREQAPATIDDMPCQVQITLAGPGRGW